MGAGFNLLGGEAQFNPLSGETGATFTLQSWGGQRSLAVRAVHTDGFNIATTLSAALALNQPTQGTPQIEFVNNAAAAVGATASVNTSGITDGNGAGSFAYDWRAQNGGTGATYILTDADVASINAGTPPEVTVTYTDGLDFQQSWTVQVLAVLAEIGLNGATVTTNARDPNNIANAETYVYQWQQSATEDGVYANISGARASVYAVPETFDAGRIFVRLSLGYQISGGDVQPALSSPVLVAGLASGAAGINLPGGERFTVGAQYTTALSGLRDVLGRAPDASAVTYQWQRAAAANAAAGDWVAISGATLQTYALAAADFPAGMPYLRVSLSDPGGYDSTSITLTAAAVDINSPATGVLSINIAANGDGQQSAPGAIYSANTGGLTDENGASSAVANSIRQYEWTAFRGGSLRLISSATVAAYTINAADFPGSGELSLRLAATYEDAFGFQVTFTAAATLTRADSIGAVGVEGKPLSPAENLTANVTVSDANGLGTLSYEWQGGNDAGAYVSLSSSGSVYAYSSWNTAHVSIRVIATHADAFGDTTTFTSTARAVNAPTEGTPRIEFVNNAPPLTGVTASVNTSNITDANGERSFAYAWNSANGGTGATYILTSTDMANIDAGNAPGVTVTYTDGLGFVRRWTVTVQVVLIEIGLSGATVTVQATDASSIANQTTYRYQWQQSATEDGVYANISANAQASTYAVPAVYDAGRIFVRLSLGYQLSGGVGVGTTLPALSTPVRVAGLASGTVGMNGSGVVGNAEYTAALNNLRDVLGRAPDASALTYQWQTGTAGGGWQDISGATSQTYRLATADFENGRSFLRVRLAARAENNNSAILESAGADINRDATGVLSINIAANGDGQQSAPGAIYSANTGDLSDANGASTAVANSIRQYEWTAFRGGSSLVISSVTVAAYTINAADFPAVAGELSLRLAATYEDAFGFQVTFTAAATLTRADSIGAVGVEGAPLSPTENLTANVTVSDANGLGTLSYEWQGGDNAGAYVSLSAVGSVYSYSSWNTAHVSIRVIATHADAFGDTTTFTSTARAVNAPTEGTPRIQFVNSAPPVTGATISVNTSNITDANGERSFAYAWNSANGGTGATYILTSTDMANIDAGNAPGVTVTYTDGLGFVRRWTVTVQAVLIEIGLNGAVVTSRATDASSIADENYVYQWQQSATEDGVYANINANAQASTYAVPATYDAGRIFVRLSLSYQLSGRTASGGGGERLPALSAPVRVAGLASGAAGMNGSGVVGNAEYTAALVHLRDVLGRAPDASVLTYQWQTGTSAGDWQDISGATSQTYRLATADFENGRSFLRVRLSARAENNNSAILESAGADINRDTTGVLSINIAANDDGQTSAPGAIYSANTGDLSDENGASTAVANSIRQYEWTAFRGGSSLVISSATVAAYTINVADFPAVAGELSLRLAATYEDAFGFQVTFTAAATLTRADSIGAVGVEGKPLSPAENLTANVTVSDANGLGTLSYEWQGGDDAGAYVSLSSAGSVYAYSSWNTAHVSIRVIATHADAFGDTTTFTSTARAVNAPTEGTPRIQFVNSAPPVTGATISVNTSNITDANGERSFAYAWKSANGGTGATYILTSTDVTNINAGNVPSVTVTYTDGLGFVRRWTVRAQVVRAEIAINGAAVNSQITDPSNVADESSYQYQWQQSATENGVYANISGAQASTYTVPTGFDAGRIFVRLSLSYQQRGGGGAVRLPALSTPVRVAGLASGAVAITAITAISGNGFDAGSTYEAVLSGLRDLLGRVPAAGDLNYQWQTGSAVEAGIWEDIAAATGQTYVLATADFGGGSRPYLRVMLGNKSGLDAEESSPPVNIEKVTGGSVRIEFDEADAFREGGVFSVQTSGVTDENGVGVFSYIWYIKVNDNATFVSVTSGAAAAAATYTLRNADFQNGTNPSLRVFVSHVDQFGFRVDFLEAQVGVTQSPAMGALLLTMQSGGFAPDAIFGVDDSAVSDINGGALAAFQWGGVVSVGGALQAESGQTGATYTLAPSWDATQEYLAVRVEHEDGFGVRTTLSTALLINQPTEGAVRFDEGLTLSTGVVVTVDVSALTDANNRTTADATLSYRWFNGAGVPTGGNAPFYTLRELDVIMSRAGQNLSVVVNYTDGIGFMTTLTATLAGGNVLTNPETAKEYGEKIDAVFNLIETNAVLGVLGSHLDGRLSGGGGGGGLAAGSLFEINGRRVDGRKDLAAALVTRTAKSQNSGKDFAVDSFAWEHHSAASGDGDGEGNEGGGGGAAWSTWIRGGWAVLEGEPLVDGKAFKYDGKSFGLYGGYDRQFGDVRVGLAVGRSAVELKVDLSLEGAGDALDDRVRRELHSVLPYVEWKGESGQLRLLGGYGVGELEVLESNAGGAGCNVTVDVDWLFGSLSGEYSLLERAGWGASVLGNVSYADSRSDAGECISGKLPETRGTAGEWLLGARLEFDGGTEHDDFNPRIGFDARRAFGDVKDDLAYDFVGGLVFGRVYEGLSFDVEGKTQLNDIIHRRDAISGRLRYTRGGVSSSWRTELGMEDGSRLGLTHRWELGYAGVWGVSSLGTKLYVEQRNAAAAASALGIGAEFWFNF